MKVLGGVNGLKGRGSWLMLLCFSVRLTKALVVFLMMLGLLLLSREYRRYTCRGGSVMRKFSYVFALGKDRKNAGFMRGVC